MCPRSLRTRQNNWIPFTPLSGSLTHLCLSLPATAAVQAHLSDEPPRTRDHGLGDRAPRAHRRLCTATSAFSFFLFFSSSPLLFHARALSSYTHVARATVCIPFVRGCGAPPPLAACWRLIVAMARPMPNAQLYAGPHARRVTHPARGASWVLIGAGT